MNCDSEDVRPCESMSQTNTCEQTYSFTAKSFCPLSDVKGYLERDVSAHSARDQRDDDNLNLHGVCVCVCVCCE